MFPPLQHCACTQRGQTLIWTKVVQQQGWHSKAGVPTALQRWLRYTKWKQQSVHYDYRSVIVIRWQAWMLEWHDNKVHRQWCMLKCTRWLIAIVNSMPMQQQAERESVIRGLTNRNHVLNTLCCTLSRASGAPKQWTCDCVSLLTTVFRHDRRSIITQSK